MTSITKAKKMIGKKIEFVPWYQTFRKDTTMTGRLLRIRGAIGGVRGRPAKGADKMMVVQPTGRTKIWMKDLGLINQRKKAVAFLLRSHKLRCQTQLRKRK